MNAARHERVREIFLKVAELPAASRATVLVEECGGDDALKREVLSLLAHERDDDDQLLTTPIVSPEVLPRNVVQRRGGSLGELARGTRIGRYTIESLVGVGGMGTVYRAVQDHPARPVALKLIRFDPANPALRKRLELEAELLGRLSHAGVASVYEAGYAITDGFRAEVPYVAMEFVEGEPLTEFAQRLGPSVHDRVRLMIRVCDAVAHAHERGVIHRDLKPANILVTRDGAPKVLDFGIARVASIEPDTAGQTLPGQVIGTLGYMSPEQLAAVPTAGGPASDVYALGVMLYELLAEELPFDPAGKSLNEFAGILRTRPPRRLGLVNRACRGDLEIITAKALAPSIERRYRSAESLREDLHRYLEKRPIAARRDSALYVIGQLARRHTVAAFLSVALLVGLLVFSVVATSLALRNDRLARNLIRSLYASRVGQAQASIQSGDIPRARSLLESLPSDQRGWEWRHLIRRTDQSIGTIALGVSAVDLAFSPDSTLLAVASSGSPIRLLRVSDGSLVWTAGDERGHIFCDYSADGRYVTAKIHADAFEIIDAASGHVVQRITVPRDTAVPFGEPILRQAFLLPDNTILGFRTFGNVYRWKLGETEPTLAWNTRLRDAGVAAISDDGQFILLATGILEADSLTIWETSTGTRKASRSGIPALQRAIFSPDGRTLAMTLHNGSIVRWDWSRDAEPHGIGAHELAVDALAYSHDGRHLATGGREGTVKIWSSREPTEPVVQVGSAAGIRALAFSHDDTTIASVAGDGLVRLWATAPEPLVPSIHVTTAAISCVVLTRDGAAALVGDRRGGVHRVDLANKSHSLIASLPEGGCRSIMQLPDGTIVVSGERGVLHFLSPAEGATLEPMTVFSVQTTFACAAHDGSFIAVRGGGKQIAIIDPAARRIEHTIDLGEVRTSAMDISFNGVIAFGTQDGKVHFVDRHGNQAAPPIQLPDIANHLQFHPEGDRILITGTKFGWNIRRVRDGAVAIKPDDDGGGPKATIFIDDGSRLASIANDRSVRVWRCDPPEELCSLVGHDGPPTAFVFDRDRGTLVSGDGLGAIRVWKDATQRHERHAAQP